MTSVRILHASDLHICTVNNLTSPVDQLTAGTLYDAVMKGIFVSSYDVAVLQRFADFLYRQTLRGRLDGLVLTGDIATTGETEDLQKAFEFFDAQPDPRLGTQTPEAEPTLKGIKLPLILLPGNHDRYRTGPGYAPGGVGYGPGGTIFDTIFTDYWRGPVMPAFNSPAEIAVYRPILKNGLAVSVIAADFNLLTSDDCNAPLGWLAQGKVYDHILDQLERSTDIVIKQWGVSHQLCVIWAIHFPPSYPRVSRLMKLIDSEKLIGRANQMGVSAVLAGHTHDPVRYRRPGMNFDVFCAGTVSQAFAPGGNHFRILDIKNDTGEITITAEDYRFRKFTAGMITDRSGFYPV